MTMSERKRKTPPRDWNGDPRELIALLRFMSGQEQREWIDKLSKSGVLSAEDVALAREMGIDLD
jgi:hypothetical protein